MTTGVVATPPILQFFNNDGTLCAGGSVLTQVGGINTATYQDVGLTTPLPNPIPLNSRGEASNAAGATVQVFLTPNQVYVFTLSDRNGNQINQATYVNGVQVIQTQASIGALLYPQTTQEAAASVTPSVFFWPPGDIRRYGGNGDSGITDNTTALQKAVNASAGAPYFVYVPNMGGYFKITSRIAVPANSHIKMEEGAELRWTATTATGSNFLGTATRPGLEITGDNFLLEGRGKITGPATVAAGSGAGGGGVTAVVTNEFAIFRIGASAANRGNNLIIRDVEISLWGQEGIVTQYMQNIQIIGCVLHDIGYAGMHHLSAQTVREYFNIIYGIAPGIGAPVNAYGISHTHDSTNYNTDPNNVNLPRQTVNPFCIDMDCAFNVIRDIPSWSAFDAHGCYEGRYHHNTVYNCHRGFQISGSSGNGANYAGENNRIESNVIYSAQINGNATTDTSGSQAGIVVNGGSTVLHRNVYVRDNVLIGMGHASASPSVFCIEATLCCDLVISGNTFRGCVGRGIYGSNSNGIIANNFFDSMGASNTGGNAIYLDSNWSFAIVQGNIINPNTGTLTTWPNGLNMPGSGYSRIVVNGNDFTSATNPYINVSGILTHNESEIIPQITDTTTGSHVANVSPAGTAPQVYYVYNGAGSATITSIIGGNVGQIVTIYVASNNTLTVNNTGSTIKLSGGTAAITQFGTLTLLCVATSGNPSFVEIGRSLTNS